MSTKVFEIRAKTSIAAGGLALLLLAGCDESGGLTLPSFGGDDTAASDPLTPASTAAVSLVERDVEAPEVFEVNEAGLWDGRPSLGGVWVAHPDVVDPERVLIKNEANGSSVIGALFRRERENPGPTLQVSSDAAAELGVLAGAPTVLKVTALRREEGPAESEVAEAFAAPAPVQATPLDAGEAAAPDTASGSAGSVVAAMTATNEAATEATSDTALTGAAAIAIAAAEASAASSTAAVVTTPVAEPAPAAPAPRSTLEKPFIQIGIFSVEENARRTADMLAADGLLGTVLAQQSQGNAFWRVIVGPSPNANDRAAVLAKVKALGFEDAYFVTN